MKLTKEECLEAYEFLDLLEMNEFPFNSDEHRKSYVIKQLINEHFELKDKYAKILDDCHDYRHETHCMKMTIRNLCEHYGVNSIEELQNIYSNKAYEPKELKEDMHTDKRREYFDIIVSSLEK